MASKVSLSREKVGMDATLLLALVATVGASAAVGSGGPGLTQTVWHNSAAAGSSNYSSVVTTAQYNKPNDQTNGALSVEFRGSIAPPTTGQYSFNCTISGGSVVLWLDDHILCGTEALFNPAPAGGHAPLPPYMVLDQATRSGFRFFPLTLVYAHASFL
jgi:hypothetical protein